MAEALDETIRDNDQGPAKASGDAGSMEQNKIPDQIAAGKYLAANSVANSTVVRRILGDRARHEVANNSYARGIVLTLANDVVSTGPRLQLLTPDGIANPQLERAFAHWSKAIGLAEKLRTMRVTVGALVSNDYERIPASAVIHWFRIDRPGQVRAVPDMLPAISLFAQLRRFTLAVIAAAETAADFAGILYTDAPANGEADAAEPIEPIELEKRALLTMPTAGR